MSSELQQKMVEIEVVEESVAAPSLEMSKAILDGVGGTWSGGRCWNMGLELDGL